MWGYDRRVLTGIMAIAAVCAALAAAGRSEPPAHSDTIERLYAGYKKRFAEVPEITVAQLVRDPEWADSVIIDAREPAERAVSMIAGAIATPDFERDAEQYRQRRIVVYCTIGSRSGFYARRLIARKFAAVNLKGGILSWVGAGEPVSGPGGITRRVHVYGKQWNLLPPGYEAVW